MQHSQSLIEDYCTSLIPVLFTVSQDFNFELRRIVCTGFCKVAKLLSMS